MATLDSGRFKLAGGFKAVEPEFATNARAPPDTSSRPESSEQLQRGEQQSGDRDLAQ